MNKLYTGKIKACILDWSGTLCDKYVIAPAIVFEQVFRKFKVPISMEHAREPMGLRKDLHIDAITKIPKVKEDWYSVYNKYPDSSDVKKMFEEFVPIQLSCLKKYSTLLPGTVKIVDRLKNEYKMKIGCTTGFTRSMVDVLFEESKKQGFSK